MGFANLTQKKESGETIAVSQGKDDGSMGMRTSVTIQTGLRGIELNAAVAHEGTHVANAQAFIATFAKNATWYDLPKNLTSFQTEMNAYRVTHSIYKAANQRFRQAVLVVLLAAG